MFPVRITRPSVLESVPESAVQCSITNATSVLPPWPHSKFPQINVHFILPLACNSLLAIKFQRHQWPPFCNCSLFSPSRSLSACTLHAKYSSRHCFKLNCQQFRLIFSTPQLVANFLRRHIKTSSSRWASRRSGRTINVLIHCVVSPRLAGNSAGNLQRHTHTTATH